MMSDDEIIAVVQAHKEGKPVQVQAISDFIWVPVSPRDDIPWDFANFRYRVKPEPRKPREWWLLDERNYAIGCSSKKETQNRYFTKDREMIHVREVIEE